jgi:phosphoglycolate phosphatase
MRRAVEAVLFDKDGTLFDFGGTWDRWGAEVMAELSGGDLERARALAASVRYDLVAQRFLPDSPVIAGTNRETAQCLLPALPGWSLPELELRLLAHAAAAPLVEAVALVPFLAALSARDLDLGVMTNDHEAVARAHLAEVGVVNMFDFIAGADSGYGAKPAPEPLLAFCRTVDVAPERAVMVGDSTHDLAAGRAAGMLCVGVLTGPASRADLAPLADAVLPDVGHLPDWLDGRI